MAGEDVNVAGGVVDKPDDVVGVVRDVEVVLLVERDLADRDGDAGGGDGGVEAVDRRADRVRERARGTTCDEIDVADDGVADAGQCACLIDGEDDGVREVDDEDVAEGVELHIFGLADGGGGGGDVVLDGGIERAAGGRGDIGEDAVALFADHVVAGVGDVDVAGAIGTDATGTADEAAGDGCAAGGWRRAGGAGGAGDGLHVTELGDAADGDVGDAMDEVVVVAGDVEIAVGGGAEAATGFEDGRVVVVRGAVGIEVGVARAVGGGAAISVGIECGGAGLPADEIAGGDGHELREGADAVDDAGGAGVVEEEEIAKGANAEIVGVSADGGVGDETAVACAIEREVGTAGLADAGVGGVGADVGGDGVGEDVRGRLAEDGGESAGEQQDEQPELERGENRDESGAAMA